jgi:DNA polymerase eta
LPEDLPFQKIRFLGGKLGDAVASEWESSSVGGLWNVSREEMRAK